MYSFLFPLKDWVIRNHVCFFSLGAFLFGCFEETCSLTCCKKKVRNCSLSFFNKTVIVNARGLDLFILIVLFVIHLSTETAVGCPDHNNRPLEFYDKDDCQPVCSHCVVTGERQTHAIAPIDEIVSKSFFQSVSLVKLM